MKNRYNSKSYVANDTVSTHVTSEYLLSVVVLSYNTKDITARCLDSLYRHAPTIADMEVVVIDNASFDGSTDAIGERFPDIKLIRNTQNRGFSAACNQGIRVSKGNIVLLLNSDAELYDQSLDVVVDYMIRNPEVGIAGGKMLDTNGEPQPSCHTFPTYKNLLFSKSSIFSGFGFFKKRYKRYRFIPENITDVDAMAGGFLFLSREVLSSVGLLDERFFFYVEDIDIARRVKSAGWRIVFIPKAGIIHLGGASTSRRPAKTYAWHHISLFKYFMKHHPLLLPINLLLGFGLAAHYCIWRLFNLFRRAGN